MKKGGLGTGRPIIIMRALSSDNKFSPDVL